MVSRAEDERQVEQPGVGRQDLRGGPGVARRHGAYRASVRLDEPAADRADAVRVERRGDPHGVGGRRRGGAGRVRGCRRTRATTVPGRAGAGSGRPVPIGRRGAAPAAGRARCLGGSLMNKAGAMAMAIISRIAQTVRRSMASGHEVRGRDRNHPDETGGIEQGGVRRANCP